jgi:succinyl-diaminopimelate desuccinylase
MEKILQKLISYPTMTGDIGAANAILKYAGDFLQSRGMFVEHFNSGIYPSLVATTQRDNKRPTVMLYCHLDVVPAPDDMFELKLEDGRYVGRGVFDMKGAAAVYLQMVDELQEQLDLYDFGILFTTDEEIGNDDENGARLSLENGYLPSVVVMPDGGDNWSIEHKAKGWLWLSLTAGGKTAHGSRPWEGDSAAMHMIETLQQIRHLLPKQQPDGLTMNIGSISGGEAINQVCDAMTADIDFRFTEATEMAAFRARLEEICEDNNIEIRVVGAGMPHLTDMYNPYVAAFRTSASIVASHELQPSLSYGGSDGRFYGEHDIPCVICRPFGGGQHSNGEWVDAGSLEEYKDILKDFLKRTQSISISAGHDRPSGL